MDILLKAIPIAIPVILVILIFLMGYVKAPPDVAYIISGLRKHPKVLIGKAGIKLPFFERLDKLSLNRIVKRRAEQFRLENDSVFHGDFF